MVANMTTDEELERYKQLLGDWHGDANGEPSSPRKRHDPEAEAYLRLLSGEEPQRAKMKPATPAAKHGDGEHVKGSILRLDDSDMVVYRRSVTGQALDMVYSLLADGSVQIEGIPLRDHKVVEIGHLPPTEMKRLQEEMGWTRDGLAKHCYSDSDRARIPDPGTRRASRTASRSPNANRNDNRKGRPLSAGPVSKSVSKVLRKESAARVPAEQKFTSPFKIRRGQTITINSKGKSWEAVYWGRDKRGSVVAHRTEERWVLMHLDLNQYKGAMKVSPDPDSLLVDQITASLKESKNQG